MLTNNINCFQKDYHSARRCLLQTASQTPVNLVQQRLAVLHPMPGPGSQTLYLDWFRLGLAPKPEVMLVLISGTHGVEGLAGSAIQCSQWSNLVKKLQENPRLGVIIIHALNPWGVAWFRRSDHEGIDLNRNFVEFAEPLPDNPSYHSIHHELFDEPSSDVKRSFSRWATKLGSHQFEEIITRGQYDYPDGLFFGGRGPSWSRTTLENLCNIEALQSAQNIAVIDLHTGLGPYGNGEVINDHRPGTKGFQTVAQWFGNEGKSALLGESYSPPKTGLLDFFWHTLIGERGCFVTLEFGTYELDDLLERCCEEQRYFNNCYQGQRARDIQHPSVVALREFFYPRDTRWQELILNRAKTVIEMALRGLTQ